VDLDRLSDGERRLPNVGIIVPTESSKVRFASSLVFRACLDAVTVRSRV
jgi:hypothetical protein